MATEESVLLVIRASRPHFRNKTDTIAFAIHATFFSAGFVLISTGSRAFAEDSLSSSSSSEEVGIDSWNELDEEYAFVYKNPKKDNKKVLLKCLVMGDKLMIDAVSDDISEPAHLDVKIDDYVAETATSDYSTQYKDLGKLVSSVRSDVLSKMDGSSAGGGRVDGLSRWFKGPSAFRLSPTQRSTSLFVDFLPFGISRMWVHGLFSGAGKVVDVYISKKRRKNNNLAFGFVRFQRREDAMAAIKLFHGWRIKYWDIKVSLARYSRDGSPFVLRNRIEQRFRVISPYKRGFKEPCVRGFKSSAEVLNGPRRTGATNTVAILAKRSDKVADIREIAKQPSVFLESSQVLESINNKPESESVAVVPLDDDVEMSLSNGDKNAKEKLGVEEKLPHPHGHDVESPPAPLAVGRQSAPKPSTVAGPDRILEQPKRSDNTQNISIKKAKGKRGFLNSKGIADYLGFYTSGPSPAVSSSHILT